MSSTNKTPNYKLSQFIGTDKPTFLGDYNNDMEIIDGVLFSASQTAEQAVNDVERIKGAQVELKNVHTETQEQVAQLKETADGMTGDVTAAQEAANSAEQKATEAQTAATGVVNAANAASVNATRAKQTADGNKKTIGDLESRLSEIESRPVIKSVTIEYDAGAFGGDGTQENGITIFKKQNNVEFISCVISNVRNSAINTVKGVSGVTKINAGETKTIRNDMLTGNSFSLHGSQSSSGLSNAFFHIAIDYNIT